MFGGYGGYGGFGFGGPLFLILLFIGVFAFRRRGFGYGGYGSFSCYSGSGYRGRGYGRCYRRKCCRKYRCYR